MTDDLHAQIRDHYGDSARRMLDALDALDAQAAGATGGAPATTLTMLPLLDVQPDTCCCAVGDAAGSAAAPGDVQAGASCCESEPIVFGPDLYGALERADLPDAAVLASLGCGNPTAVAELHPGETVLDLGSGGGIDVLLSAKRVGPGGRAIGVDMTDDMLALARRNAAEASATNVEFVKGTIESLPLDSSTVDVVISNCVINLAADKRAVFREIARVLRPGGRMAVSDVVAEDLLSEDERRERGSWAACYAGALSFGEYADGLVAAGLVDVEIVTTHSVADRMHAAIVRARKPITA
jgi:SAM-dependent methyltransferase